MKIVIIWLFVGLVNFHIFCSFVPAAPAPAADFTIAVLPDTQFYSRKYPQIFQAQTDWVIANRTRLNIVYVAQLGDIVDGGEKFPEQWLAAMGLAGPTPYKLNFTRGKLEATTYYATVAPERFGVAGDVATPAEIAFNVPLRLRGVKPRWPAGIWREGGAVVFTGVFEATAWPLLDVSQKGRFYAGNLLTADNPDLVLAIVKWTKDAITIDAHNPTDAPITATVSTPAEITGFKAFQRKVTLPAGRSIMLE